MSRLLMLSTLVALSAMASSGPPTVAVEDAPPDGQGGRLEILPPSRAAVSRDWRKSPGTRQRQRRKNTRQKGGRR